MKKHILTLFCSFVMMFCIMTMTANATESSENTADSGTITRVEWLAKLTEAFDMYVEEENYPDNYFSDLSSDSEDYYTVILAVEFGVLDIEAGDEVRPNDPATREFAAQTLNYCLGFQLENEEYSFSDTEAVSYPEDAQIALDRGWFELTDGKFEPQMAITIEEAEKMLVDAQTVRASATVVDNHDDTYKFADYVVEIPAGTELEVDENDVVSVLDCPKAISEGDTFVIWPSEMPSIYVAESVVTEENVTTITTSEADTAEAVLSVDSSGTVDMDLSVLQEWGKSQSLSIWH